LIRSYRNKGLQRFAETGDASKLSIKNVKRIERIIAYLDEATAPEMMDFPGLRFHALKGSDKGRYAVNASANYRVTFGWDGEDAIDVDLEDYH
jgi:proteic killer suppression protein